MIIILKNILNIIQFESENVKILSNQELYMKEIRNSLNKYNDYFKG